jgi:Na+/phosphate symporter
MTNVIDFTKHYKKRLEEISDLKQDVAELNKKIAMKFSIDVAHDVVGAMTDLGFDVTQDPETVLDIMLLIESVRALINRSIGEEYHFQSVSERIFSDSEMDCEEALFDFLEQMDESDNDFT